MSSPTALPHDARRPRLLHLGILVVCLGAFAVHAASYLPFLSDDALISLRYTQRFLAGDGLTWNDGERVEGYSNLLWILGSSGLGLLGLDLIVTQRVLGLLTGGLAILVVVGARPARNRREELARLAAGAVLATSGTLAVWGVGGLEVDLVALLVAAALAGALSAETRAAGKRDGPLLWTAAALALLVWTRPDTALFTPTLGLGLLLVARARPRELLLVLGLPALAWLGQLAFRLAYYDAWLPNTAHAKLAVSLERLVDGLTYLGEGLLWAAPLAVLVLASAVVLVRTGGRGRLLLLALPALAWALYALLVMGGDVFPGRRHLAPLWVTAALIVREGAERWLAAGSHRRGALIALGALALGALGLLQLRDPDNLRARRELWEWDGRVAGLLLRDAFGARDPLLAVDPAGCLPYFSGLRSLDMLGLNDAHIAAHPPEGLGTGIPGHELGDGAYVLDREPDIVLFTQPSGRREPTFKSAREMARDPRFAERYRYTVLLGRRPRDFVTRPWIRAEGGRLGIERGAEGVRVPGWFLTELGENDARLDPEGVLAAVVARSQPGGILALALPAGSYELVLDGAAGELAATVTRTGSDGEPLAAGPTPLAFELARDGRVDLLLEAATEAPTHVRAAFFRRSVE